MALVGGKIKRKKTKKSQIFRLMKEQIGFFFNRERAIKPKVVSCTVLVFYILNLHMLLGTRGERGS